MSNNNPYILPLNNINISKAAKMLQNGELVAFPTETVYGLGARADDANAVAKIYQYKGRPPNNPLIVHVSDFEMAKRYGIFNDMATKIASSFFPASLTLVVQSRAGAVAENARAGGETVALRCPNHSGARALIKEAGLGIAAPSANISGKISPTNAQHVLHEFAGRELLILDGGSCEIGLESTVIDCSNDKINILRHGAVTKEMLIKYLGEDLFVDEALKSGGEGSIATLKSPGQLESHYAPNAAVYLNVTAPTNSQVYLGFGEYGMNAELNLSKSGDLYEAAHNLYAHLRKADEIACENNLSIAIAPIPNIGIGVAINDRLSRAATD
jgi:L-threonylcarbamoyladenylate synthase